jgi:hypothetical protein
VTTNRFLASGAVAAALSLAAACGPGGAGEPTGQAAPATAAAAVTWSVQEAGGGTIGADGRYTAPATAGLYHVVAVSVADPSRSASGAVTVTAAPTGCPPAVVLGVIGDFGSAGPNEAAVAALVRGWAPDAVLTVGDNNYEFGQASTIDDNIGQYYASFIAPYQGRYGPGAAVNAFFPTLGNHDWANPAPGGGTNAQPYLDYFALPGNERYYDVVLGEVHLFAVDSDPHEPDGTSSTSAQAQWLRAALAASTSRWNLVTFHHPPYSSGSSHGSTTSMRWPFEAWGASAVISGHEHLYERLAVGGIPYFVNGLGGDSIYSFGSPLSQSQVRYNRAYGAQRVVADGTRLTFEFFAADGTLVDALSIPAANPCVP